MQYEKLVKWLEDLRQTFELLNPRDTVNHLSKHSSLQLLCQRNIFTFVSLS